MQQKGAVKNIRFFTARGFKLLIGNCRLVWNIFLYSRKKLICISAWMPQTEAYCYKGLAIREKYSAAVCYGIALHTIARRPHTLCAVPASLLLAKNSPPDCFLYAQTFIMFAPPVKKSPYRPKGQYGLLVRVTGVEPACFWHKNLNLACLPIPPHPHIKK